MLQENRIVTPAPQVSDRGIGTRLRCRWTKRAAGGLLRIERFGSCLIRPSPRFIDRPTRRAGHGLRDLAQELFEAGHRRSPELWARHRDVHVEVSDRLLEFFRMLLAPLRRSNQSFLFCIPTPEYQRPFRLPSGLQQLPDPVHGFEHRRRPAVWIHRAIHPCIPVIPSHDTLVRQFAPAYPPDHVPARAVLVILLEMDFHFCRAGTDVVGERQRSLPLSRRLRPTQVLENGPRIRIGEGSGWNPWHLRRLLRRYPLGG